MQLITSELRAGIWRGVFQSDRPAPDIRVLHLGRELPGVTVSVGPKATDSVVQVPVPSEFLSDGVHTYLVQNTATNATVASFSIVAGTVLDADLRAEIDLLRAEVELLKTAFRQHCADTGAV